MESPEKQIHPDRTIACNLARDKSYAAAAAAREASRIAGDQVAIEVDRAAKIIADAAVQVAAAAKAAAGIVTEATDRTYHLSIKLADEAHRVCAAADGQPKPKAPGPHV